MNDGDRGGDDAGLTGWSADVFEACRARRIDLIATVPDGGLTPLLAAMERAPGVDVVTLSTEEEGVAVAVGAWLGGRRAALFMQSSGVGNCVNMLSLPAMTRAPLPILVTMRGEWGEFNAWQTPMGRAVRPSFEAMGVAVRHCADEADVGPTFEAMCDLAFNTGAAAATLVGQRVVGAKQFVGEDVQFVGEDVR